jgi:hypothetical protein
VNDHEFWDGISESPEKTSLQSINNNCDYGLYYITFSEFCEQFNQIHYCNLNSGGKFLSEQILLGPKATFFDVTIQREDVYTFELNQSKIPHNHN